LLQDSSLKGLEATAKRIHSPTWASAATLLSAGAPLSPSAPALQRIVEQLAKHGSGGAVASIAAMVSALDASPTATATLTDDAGADAGAGGLSEEQTAPMTGHLFCFLPLPLETGVPVHLNAPFALTSNRRSLWEGTGGEGSSSEKADWNQLMLTELLPQVWVSYSLLLPLGYGCGLCLKAC
jgi:hypothetical protein